MQRSTRYISAWEWYCWWEVFGRFSNLDRYCFLWLVSLPSFSCSCLRICGTVIMSEWLLFIWCCYTPLGCQYLNLSVVAITPTEGLSGSKDLFYNFVSLWGSERWLRKRFVKYGIPLLPWLLRRAVVVIFSKPGSGKSSQVNFRWLHFPSQFCFIVVVSWLMLLDPFSVQQTTAGKKDPIDVVRSNTRPASKEVTNIEIALRMKKWKIT